MVLFLFTKTVENLLHLLLQSREGYHLLVINQLVHWWSLHQSLKHLCLILPLAWKVVLSFCGRHHPSLLWERMDGSWPPSHHQGHHQACYKNNQCTIFFNYNRWFFKTEQTLMGPETVKMRVICKFINITKRPIKYRLILRLLCLLWLVQLIMTTKGWALIGTMFVDNAAINFPDGGDREGWKHYLNTYFEHREDQQDRWSLLEHNTI